MAQCSIRSVHSSLGSTAAEWEMYHLAHIFRQIKPEDEALVASSNQSHEVLRRRLGVLEQAKQKAEGPT